MVVSACGICVIRVFSTHTHAHAHVDNMSVFFCFCLCLLVVGACLFWSLLSSARHIVAAPIQLADRKNYPWYGEDMPDNRHKLCPNDGTLKRLLCHWINCMAHGVCGVD